MKKIPIIVTLILIIAWGYTAWYWYVCNIKGLCDANTYIQTSVNNEDIQAGINASSTNNAEILTADDVLTGNVVNDTVQQEKEAAMKKELLAEESTGDTSTGSTDVAQEDQENTEEVLVSSNICSEPLIGPIAFGGNNNVDEVTKLEKFLIGRGESITEDGIYSQEKLDAVKKFQLEFKQEVLDPWGITTPTGYVGKTTVQKINEIACK